MLERENVFCKLNSLYNASCYRTEFRQEDHLLHLVVIEVMVMVVFVMRVE